MRQLSEHEALLCFNAVTTLGAQRLAVLYRKYGSYAAIWKSIGINADIDKIHAELKKKQIKYCTLLDLEYPELLKEIGSPPIVLYYQGNLSLLKSKCLGIVGTRRASAYGEQVVSSIVPELVAAGLTIVSGFQKGIDTLAHKATLECGGKTIAVLGTGLDIEYPTGNNSLKDKIINSGSLYLSEYPPQTLPFKANFPRRNRIISGLSVGVVVVEASQKSGSLITSNCALEQNREVFAVPGSIFSQYSFGPHYLIQQGAKLVQNAQEICTELGIRNGYSTEIAAPQNLELSSSQQKIMASLDVYGKHLDTLIIEIGLEITELLAELTILELNGLVVNSGNGIYSKNRS